MSDGPTTPAPTTPHPTPPTKEALAERPGIKNADVPSETVGLPGVGEGASATHYARDTVGLQANDGNDKNDETDDFVPADPRDSPDTPS